MKSKIIGFDGSRSFLKEKTGTENYSYQLLKALAKLDHKNQYIVYLRTQGVPLRGWPRNFEFRVINWPRLWTQAGLAGQTFTDQLDVLFVPAHTIPLVRRPGLKTVVTVHDLGSEYLPGMHQLKQRLYLGFMQRHQLKNATKIIAVSNATKKDLVNKIGLDPDKIEVVYEGYDQEKFKGQNSKVKNKEYFLFVGTVQPRKNLERIIIAFSRQLSASRQKTKKSEDRRLMTDDYLVIAGSKGWLSDEIYKLPKKLGIEDRVKFLGRVEDQDLPALYSGAIALVFPSLFEGFGLPILEAQASGCPVITSNISSMPEVAGKGAILVNPESVDDIVRGMMEIGEIKGIREGLIKKGLENVKRFSWEKAAKKTLKVLEAL